MAELTNRPRFCVRGTALRIGHSLTHSPRFAARALSVRCTVASRVCKRSTRRDSDPAPSARVFLPFRFFFAVPARHYSSANELLHRPIAVVVVSSGLLILASNGG
jgi:hypothetical protein